MRDEKKVYYGGGTYLVKNVAPDITDTERKLILQGIADDLAKVFKRR